MKKYSFAKLVATCIFLSTSLFFISCSDDDSKPDPTPPFDGKTLWSETMAGNDLEEIAWPDRSENYWEYTLDVTENPNIGVKFKGEFPKKDVRFFNFTFYNDLTTQRIVSIEDFDITPDEGSTNPFTTENGSGSENNFEVTIVPDNTPESVKSKLKNVLEFPLDKTKKLSVLLRIYFNSDDHGTDFGGVDLPNIVFFDTTTGEELEEANRTESRYYAMCKLIASQIPEIKPSDYMVFTLAPDVMYSNGPTGYVTSANTVTKGAALAFRFMPPTYPKTVAENRTADMRYWSICVGDAVKTITPVTIPDSHVITDGDYVNFIIIDANDPRKAELMAKASSMKINLIEWESEKYGEELMIFYRQMHILNAEGEYSVKRVPSYPPLGANGLPDTSAPFQNENMAHNVLKGYGPCGQRLTTDYVLSSDFKYDDMRMPYTMR